MKARKVGKMALLLAATTALVVTLVNDKRSKVESEKQ